MSDVDILHFEHVVHLSVANEPETTMLFISASFAVFFKVSQFKCGNFACNVEIDKADIFNFFGLCLNQKRPSLLFK